MMCMCGKCKKLTGSVLVVVGLIYLISDLAPSWNFPIEWYTIAFLMLGLLKIATTLCPDCIKVCGDDSGKKRK